MKLRNFLHRLLALGHRFKVDQPTSVHEPIDHVVILDGTMSTLEAGRETNAGRLYKLLCRAKEESGAVLSLKYEAGIQWRGARHALDVIAGVGIDGQICRAYRFIAEHYRPGDRIFLFGYSRGAYAVRSIAGAIDQVGLLCAETASEENIHELFDHYQNGGAQPLARQFAAEACHAPVEIEMVGVWDTVKAIGIDLPLLRHLMPPDNSHHDHYLGNSVRKGYHALGLDETRTAFEPVLWECPPERERDVEQVWFRGAHGDVGGDLGEFHPARPLANIPLYWMLEKAEARGLPLPEGWRKGLARNVNAPELGTWRGFDKLFWRRQRRIAGRDRSEYLHESVTHPVKARLVGKLMRKAPTGQR